MTNHMKHSFFILVFGTAVQVTSGFYQGCHGYVRAYDVLRNRYQVSMECPIQGSPIPGGALDWLLPVQLKPVPVEFKPDPGGVRLEER